MHRMRRSSSTIQPSVAKKDFRLNSLSSGLFVFSISGDDSLGTLFFTDVVLGASGITLGFEFNFSLLFGLLLVDGLDENVLVLVEVTFSSHVEGVVKSTVDLLGVSITSEKSSEDSLSAHPDEFGGHTGVSGSLSATGTSVTSSTDGGVPSLCSGARVDADLTSHDEVVFLELANVLAYIQRRLLVNLRSKESVCEV